MYVRWSKQRKISALPRFSLLGIQGHVFGDYLSLILGEDTYWYDSVTNTSSEIVELWSWFRAWETKNTKRKFHLKRSWSS